MGAIIDTLNKRKVELKSEQIDLSSVKELKSFLKIIDANEKESEKEGEKFVKAESTLSKAYDALMKHRNAIHSTWSGAKAVLEDFEKKAKTLGVNPSDISEYSQLSKRRNELYEYIKLFDTVKDYKGQL